VLDIAAGTGEPGLTMRFNTYRTVTGTDLAEGMLETANANAEAKGIKITKLKWPMYVSCLLTLKHLMV